MVGFGQRLSYESEHLLPESWKGRLLDYEQLKNRLEAASLAAQSEEETSVADFVKTSTRNSFQLFLDSEIARLLAHFKQHSATLVKDVENLRRETTVWSDRLALGDCCELTKNLAQNYTFSSTTSALPALRRGTWAAQENTGKEAV